MQYCSELDADAELAAMSEVALDVDVVSVNNQTEFVRQPRRNVAFEQCTARRDIADEAGNAGAAGSRDPGVPKGLAATKTAPLDR